MKQSKNNYTYFEYNPHGRILRFNTDESFYYNFDSFEFEMDHNPFGNPVLSKINNVVFKNNNHEIEFDTTYKLKEKHVILNCCNNQNVYIYRLFTQIHKTVFSVNESDLDRIIVGIDNNKLDKIEIYKRNKNNILLNNITVNKEDNALYIETFMPYLKERIEKIKIDNEEIILNTNEKEYIFQFDTQNIIINCVKLIIDSCNNKV